MKKNWPARLALFSFGDRRYKHIADDGTNDDLEPKSERAEPSRIIGFLGFRAGPNRHHTGPNHRNKGKNKNEIVHIFVVSQLKLYTTSPKYLNQWINIIIIRMA